MKIIIESKNENSQVELSNYKSFKEHCQSFIMQVTNGNNDTVSMLLDTESAEELEQALSTMRYLIDD